VTLQSPLLRVAAVIVLAMVAAVPAALVTSDLAPRSGLFDVLERTLGHAAVPIGAGVFGVILNWKQPERFGGSIGLVLMMSALFFLGAWHPWA
jgi:hypothetical protein